MRVFCADKKMLKQPVDAAIQATHAHKVVIVLISDNDDINSNGNDNISAAQSINQFLDIGTLEILFLLGIKSAMDRE